MKLKLHLARLSLLRWGITASPLREGRYVDTIGGESIELSHSGFNVKWMQQLGIEAKTIVELGAYDGGDALRFSKQLPNCRVAKHQSLLQPVFSSDLTLPCTVRAGNRLVI